MNDDEIAIAGTRETCPHCSYQNRLLLDYHKVVEVLKGGDPNMPLIRCTGCGKRLALCSVCTVAINDGYITENERDCDNCPILAYWNKKYGEDPHGEEKETSMTEEKKTPSLEDITKSFYEKCECTRHSYDLSCNKPCDYCGVGVSGINSGCSGEGTSMGECVQKYIYEVATGARDINKPLWNPPKAPSWCKVGMWVTRNDCFTVEQVTDIKEGEIAVGYAYDDEAEFYRMFKPVRFRPYDYKEAKALLGKTMEYEPPYLQVRYEGALIHRVTQYECAEEIHLNSRSFSAWKEMNATIDDLPIGVPVVDEKLLSNH